MRDMVPKYTELRANRCVGNKGIDLAVPFHSMMMMGKQFEMLPGKMSQGIRLALSWP